MLNLKYVIDNGLNWLNYVNVMLVGDLNEILFLKKNFLKFKEMCCY